MPAPAYTIARRAEVKPAGFWVALTTSSIDAISSSETAGGGPDAPLAFGDASTATAQLTIARSALPSPWRDTPIRIFASLDGVEAQVFAGTITGFSGDLDTVQLSAAGFATLISRVRAYSPLFVRRPVATKTTVASIEDPSNGAYAAGAMNYLFWQAGGRPYEQAGSYASAPFFYSCDHAILAPEYSWIAAEDGWSEVQQLAQAAGMAVFQSRDGVVRARNALAYVGASPSLTLTSADYTQIREARSASPVVTGYTVPYTPRLARPNQEVVRDDTPRFLAASGAGATIEAALQPQQPLLSVEQKSAGQLPDDCFQAAFYSGPKATPGTDFTHSLAITAQRVTVTIVNISGKPIRLDRLILRGQPIIAGEAGSLTIGTTANLQTAQASAYVQSRSHAERYANLYLAFAGVERPVLTVDGCVPATGVQIGDTASLTASELGYSATRCLITGISRQDGEPTVSYTLVPVNDLDLVSDYFLVSSSSQAGLTKRIGF